MNNSSTEKTNILKILLASMLSLVPNKRGAFTEGFKILVIVGILAAGLALTNLTVFDVFDGSQDRSAGQSIFGKVFSVGESGRFASPITAFAGGNFAGGSGTVGDPFLIEDCADLDAMRISLGSYLLL